MQQHYGRPRVVLVDDNERFRLAIAELLMDAGIQIIGQAADGVGALRMIPPLTITAPVVALMDLRMPGPINGIEATRLLVDRCQDIQVIIFTAFPGEGIHRAAHAAGAVDLLLKGTSAENLIAAIRRAWTGAVCHAG